MKTTEQILAEKLAAMIEELDSKGLFDDGTLDWSSYEEDYQTALSSIPGYDGVINRAA